MSMTTTTELWEKVYDAVFVATVRDELTALRTHMEQLERDRNDGKRLLQRKDDALAFVGARVEQLEQRLEAKDKLLVAYRLGDQHRADEALTALAALDQEDTNG